MRRYEAVVVLDPDMADDDILSFQERYSNLIASHGGEVIKMEDWGLKKLAYHVNKRDKGRYIFIDFAGLPALMTEIERQFKITEEVMKFLSVKLDDEVDLESIKRAPKEEAAPTEAEEKPAAAPAEEPVAEPEAPAAEEASSEPPSETSAPAATEEAQSEADQTPKEETAS